MSPLPLWLALFSLVFAACSSGIPKGTTESFKTRITDTGLKHFELRLHYARPDRPIYINPNPYRQNRRPPSSRPDTEREGEWLARKLEDNLAKIMEQSDYCRDGYWILKADPFDRSPFIRGECNDLATPEDRARYPDTLLIW